jgi:3-oxoadipate enol-lactonase
MMRGAWRGVLLASMALPRLTGAQAAPAGRFLTLDRSRVYYEECGAGPAIVLLHDGLVHSVTWDAVWPLLCAHFHVLRYDRRGMGRSDPPTRPFIPAEDLTALLADRQVASATLVGSSSGGGLAIDYAFRHPDNVDRLVLIGPVVHGMPSSDHFLERGAKSSAPLESGDVRAAAMNWANDPYLTAAGHDSARRALFDVLAANPQNLRYQGDLELRFAVPAATRIGEIRAPALILVGESDIPDVQAYSGAVELGIWGAKREVVRDAGHLIQLEHPAWLAQRIGDFIRQTPVVSLRAERLQELAGSYEGLMYGRPGQFLVSDGRLFVRIQTERDLPLFASSDSTFYALAWGGIRFMFHRDGTGRASGVDVIERGGVRRAARSPS